MEPWRTAIVDAQRRPHPDPRLRRDVVDDRAHVHRHDLPAAPIAAADAAANGRCSTPSCPAWPITGQAHRRAPRRVSRCRAIGSRVSAAIAAGILAVGDEHGGAGSGCMEMIAAGIERAKRRSLSFDDGRPQWSQNTRASGRRVAGFGHRVHTHDPRTPVLFDLARRERPRRATASRSWRRSSAAVAAQVKPLTDQHRRRAGGGALRHGLSAAVRPAGLHHRPRRRPHGRGHGRAGARTADAHPDSGRPTTANRRGASTER